MTMASPEGTLPFEIVTENAFSIVLMFESKQPNTLDVISLFSTYDYSDRRKITTSVLLGIWYAITDEVHQLLVSGRNGSLFDVYIDSLGFATGVCSMLILIKLVEILKNRKKEEKK